MKLKLQLLIIFDGILIFWAAFYLLNGGILLVKDGSENPKSIKKN